MQVTDQTQWDIPVEEAGKTGPVSPRSPRGEDGTEEDDKTGADYAAAGKRKNRQVIMAESYDPAAGSKVEVKRVDKPEKSKCVLVAGSFLERSLLQASIDL